MQKISSNLIEVTNILNDLKYHNDNEIASRLSLSPIIIWQIIEKLLNYGIEIELTNEKYYRLKNSLILIDEKKINADLSDKNIHLEVFETLNSTNDYLKNFIKSNKMIIAISEHLSNARGRMERKWHAPFGKNIYLSCGFNFKKKPTQLYGLSLVVGLSLIKSFNVLNLKQNISIKWPNDIIWQGNKIAGILIEIITQGNDCSYVVIGIGLNVNMKSDYNKKIIQPWTSLINLTNEYIDRNHLLVSIIKELFIYLLKFNQVGLEGFREEWSKFDILLNKKIKILSNKKEFEGISKGIDNEGNIIIELENGQLKSYSSGDATIVKNK